MSDSPLPQTGLLLLTTDIFSEEYDDNDEQRPVDPEQALPDPPVLPESSILPAQSSPPLDLEETDVPDLTADLFEIAMPIEQEKAPQEAVIRAKAEFAKYMHEMDEKKGDNVVVNKAFNTAFKQEETHQKLKTSSPLPYRHTTFTPLTLPQSRTKTGINNKTYPSEVISTKPQNQLTTSPFTPLTLRQPRPKTGINNKTYPSEVISTKPQNQLTTSPKKARTKVQNTMKSDRTFRTDFQLQVANQKKSSKPTALFVSPRSTTSPFKLSKRDNHSTDYPTQTLRKVKNEKPMPAKNPHFTMAPLRLTGLSLNFSHEKERGQMRNLMKITMSF
ncbi:hypothetical protein [Pasteurella sp. PK-2025]|uniref:hypothetical protein n=1 Tax=Pasteurella sp. PK-2025 TaxID=3413133 RepID=UPI003C77FF61